MKTIHFDKQASNTPPTKTLKDQLAMSNAEPIDFNPPKLGKITSPAKIEKLLTESET
ncbi:MAG: hypothetical protein ACWA5R_02470 [bacterium]